MIHGVTFHSTNGDIRLDRDVAIEAKHLLEMASGVVVVDAEEEDAENSND